MMMIFDSDKEEGTTAGSYNMIKGKRTKRPRPPSPLALTMVNVAEESSGGDRILFSDNNNNNNNNNIVSGSNSPATSINGFSTSTEEEEDMANCLILLAQGHTHNTPKKLSITEAAPINFIDNNSNNISGRSKTSSFLVNYQCKTCNRCFPSFQALGGHRASHKKPKTAAVGTTTPDVFLNEESKKELAMAVSMMDRHEKYEERFSNGGMSTTLSLQISNSKGGISGNNNNISLKSGNNNNKVHECSICGSEFSSGQALGGHMRRHRAFVNTTAAAATATAATTSLSMGTSGSFDDHQFQTTRQPVAKKPRHILQLDLNLPAPEDHHDRRESKFGFASKEQVIVFSASSLVDCHY